MTEKYVNISFFRNDFMIKCKGIKIYRDHVKSNIPVNAQDKSKSLLGLSD